MFISINKIGFIILSFFNLTISLLAITNLLLFRQSIKKRSFLLKIYLKTHKPRFRLAIFALAFYVIKTFLI